MERKVVKPELHCAHCGCIIGELIDLSPDSDKPIEQRIKLHKNGYEYFHVYVDADSPADKMIQEIKSFLPDKEGLTVFGRKAIMLLEALIPVIYALKDHDLSLAGGSLKILKGFSVQKISACVLSLAYIPLILSTGNPEGRAVREIVPAHLLKNLEKVMRDMAYGTPQFEDQTCYVSGHIVPALEVMERNAASSQAD